MRKILIPVLALFGFVAPLAVAVRADAALGEVVSYTLYGSPANKVFASVNSGTRHNSFHVHITCQSTQVNGGEQSNPGPWYGSTATCPVGQYVTAYHVTWS